MRPIKFYTDVALAVVVLALTLALCRVTYGGMAILVALVGATAALLRKPSVAIPCYLFFPLITVFNKAVVGDSPVLGMSARLGGLLIIVALLFSGIAFQNFRHAKLPIGWLSLYVSVAMLSSLGGWMPFISYMKLMNFVLMLVGLVLLAKLMQMDERALRVIRAVMMAMAIIMIVGSFLSYFVPSVGYSMLIYKMAAWGNNITGQEIVQSDGKVLFNGMTNHSQTLSPVVMMLAAWVLLDMILVERRFSWLHTGVLFFVPLLAYMSRSRGAFIMLIALIGMSFVIVLPRARIGSRVRRHLGLAATFGAVALVGVAVYFEMRDEVISRWLRKTDNVASDSRTLGEAVTESRRELIDENLRDFKRNPIFGMGFQVAPGMDYAYRAGLITWYAAPIEKGVTPYVILGECGILGAGAFLVFLCAFYGTCLKKHYLSLLTAFTCLLVANLADSTLFSPSGMGGFMWAISCIAAFSTDILSQRISFCGYEGK